MKSYGQFCPIAKASEILMERWTPLVLRELLMGCRRFNEIERGVPRIPRSLLVQRLRALERAGVIERRPGPNGRTQEYHLTPAGEEALPVLTQLGEWGQRWANGDVEISELDPSLLMWDMRRRIDRSRLPAGRIVVQFDFTGQLRESWWVVIEPEEISVCREDFGFEVDLLVTADTRTLHRLWIGRTTWDAALRSEAIRLDGPRKLVRDFPSWLELSRFAAIPPARMVRLDEQVVMADAPVAEQYMPA